MRASYSWADYARLIPLYSGVELTPDEVPDGDPGPVNTWSWNQPTPSGILPYLTRAQLDAPPPPSAAAQADAATPASLEERIDRAIDNLCPCGAEPEPGSAYCGYDCRPNHIGRDTDQAPAGWGDLSTPMRWRPDMVTDVDDSDLIPLPIPTGYRGACHAQVFRRGPAENLRLHLRLDDGYRFVGTDLTVSTGPGTETEAEQLSSAWVRLEHELQQGADRDMSTGDVGRAWLRDPRLPHPATRWLDDRVSGYGYAYAGVAHRLSSTSIELTTLNSVLSAAVDTWAGAFRELAARRRGRGIAGDAEAWSACVHSEQAWTGWWDAWTPDAALSPDTRVGASADRAWQALRFADPAALRSQPCPPDLMRPALHGTSRRAGCPPRWYAPPRPAADKLLLQAMFPSNPEAMTVADRPRPQETRPHEGNRVVYAATVPYSVGCDQSPPPAIARRWRSRPRDAGRMRW